MTERVYSPQAMSQRLRKLCQQRRISNAVLAAKLGLDPSNTNKWWNGRHKISLNSAACIAIALDVSLDWLVFGVDTRDERAAVLLRRASERERVMREALFEIRSVLDANMGDSDPIGLLPPDDVLRDEKPHFYCCIIASRALATLESTDD